MGGPPLAPRGSFSWCNVRRGWHDIALTSSRRPYDGCHKDGPTYEWQNDVSRAPQNYSPSQRCLTPHKLSLVIGQDWSPHLSSVASPAHTTDKSLAESDRA